MYQRMKSDPGWKLYRDSSFVGCNPVEVGKAAAQRIAELEAALRDAEETFATIAIPPVDPNDGVNHARNNITLAKHGLSRVRLALGI